MRRFLIMVALLVGVLLFILPHFVFQSGSSTRLLLYNSTWLRAFFHFDNVSQFGSLMTKYISQSSKPTSSGLMKPCTPKDGDWSYQRNPESEDTRLCEQPPLGSPVAGANRPHCVIVHFNDRWLKFEDASHALLNWNCWAFRHKYKLLLNFRDVPPLQLMTDRWESILHLHEECDAILSMDGDTFIHNMSFAFHEVLGNHSMVFSFRENGEIISGAVMLRLDSWTVSFLRQWICNIGIVCNSDNGALIFTLAQRSGITQCAHKGKNYLGWVRCVRSHASMIKKADSHFVVHEAGV